MEGSGDKNDALDLSLEVLASRIMQRNAELFEQSQVLSNDALSQFQLDGSYSTVSDRRSPSGKQHDRPKPLRLHDEEGIEVCPLDTNPMISLPAEPVDEDLDQFEFFLDDDEPLKKTASNSEFIVDLAATVVMDKSALAAVRNEKPTASITSDLSHIAPMSFIKDSSFLKDPATQQSQSK